MRTLQNMIYAAILLFTGLTIPGRSAEIIRDEKKTFKLSPDGLINLDAAFGDILVRSGDSDQVELTIIRTANERNHKRAQYLLDHLEISVQQTGDRLYIREQEKRNGETGGSYFNLGNELKSIHGLVDVDYLLNVPQSVRLKLSAEEGNIDVAGTKNDLDLETDHGDINVANAVSDRIHLSCDDGIIRIRNVNENRNGFLRAEADEGEIRLENVTIQTVELRIDEGDIKLKEVTSDRLVLKSDEGDILAEWSSDPMGNIRITTDEGDVRITISDKANASVYLETEEGTIDSKFSLRQSETDSGEKMEGNIGKGGARIKAWTHEGDIMLGAGKASRR